MQTGALDVATGATRGVTRGHLRWLASVQMVVEPALLVLGLLLLAVTLRPWLVGDDLARAHTATVLLDGHVEASKYSLVQPILSAAGARLAQVAGISAETIFLYFNFVVFLGLGGLLWWAVRLRYGKAMASRVGLIVLAASMLPAYLQHFGAEVLGALAVSVAVMLPRGGRWAAVSLVGLAVANTPGLALPLALAGLVMVVGRRNWMLVAGVGAGAAGILVENLVKFGALVGTPYLADGEHGLVTVLPYSGLPGYSYPLVLGVLSILFSFGRGLVWYMPGLMLIFDQRVRQAARMGAVEWWALAAFVIGLVLAYAKWWSWYGGFGWGPRFFVILSLPVSLGLALAITVQNKNIGRLAWTSSLLAISTWVAIDGYVFGQASLDICQRDGYQLEFLCWYVPEFSALLRPFVTGAILYGSDSPRFLFSVFQVATSSYLLMVTVLAGRVRAGSWRTRQVEK